MNITSCEYINNSYRIVVKNILTDTKFWLTARSYVLRSIIKLTYNLSIVKLMYKQLVMELKHSKHERNRAR